MFSVFKKKEVATFKEARDMSSFAFHIEDPEGNVLCGTTRAMYGTKEVTPEHVIDSIPNQHGGWHWCRSCGTAFTGLSSDAFAVTQK